MSRNSPNARSAMEPINIGISVEKKDEHGKKARKVLRPPLSKNLINILTDFLIQEDRRPVPGDSPVWRRPWLALLREDTDLQMYAKELSLKQRFVKWLNALDVRTTGDGEFHLCLAVSKKIVPCKEDFRRIIRDAHRSTGEFEMINAKENLKQEKSKVHNSAKKCIRMVS